MDTNSNQTTSLRSRYRLDTVEDQSMHAPDLYHHDAVADLIDGLDAIGDEEIAFFEEHGYLAVKNAFTEQETADALAGMIDLIMGRVANFDGISFERRAADRLDQMTLGERQDAVRKLADFIEYEPRLNAMAEHPKLLDVVRRLMGGHEPKMLQNMGLIKPPKIGREKPWHQDCAYFDLPMGTPVVGVWIAFDSATIENGCMRVLEGAHKEGPIHHWKRRDWQICDAEMYEKRGKPYEVVAAPLEPGGALLFSGMLPHGTPHNSSPERRRAVQYHYYPEGTSTIPAEERMSAFGTEGKDVEC